MNKFERSMRIAKTKRQRLRAAGSRDVYETRLQLIVGKNTSDINQLKNMLFDEAIPRINNLAYVANKVIEAFKK
jgi:hypothetical protein